MRSTPEEVINALWAILPAGKSRLVNWTPGGDKVTLHINPFELDARTRQLLHAAAKRHGYRLAILAPDPEEKDTTNGEAR